MPEKIIDVTEVINSIRHLEKWCDLITEDALSKDISRCYGHPDECKVCEFKKYRLKYY